MFDSLRDTLQTVQEGISASFRGLATGELPQVTRTPERRAVNINAGGDILHHYQTKWNELHTMAEENAKKAQEVDEYIGTIRADVSKQWTDLGAMYGQLTRLPQLMQDTEQLITNIGSLQKTIENAEMLLIQLEDIVETQQFQEQQLEKRFQLAMHREKRLGELENVRSGLSRDHTEKLDRHEKRIGAVQKEKQATYGEAFQNDLEHYKKYGSLPKEKQPAGAVAERVADERSLSLEEVILEDTEDNKALDDLLNG